MILKSILGFLFNFLDYGLSIYLSSSLPILRLEYFFKVESDLHIYTFLTHIHRMRQKVFFFFKKKNLLDSLAASSRYDVFSKNVALHPVVVLAQLPVQLYYGPYSELMWLQQNFWVNFQFISSDWSWLDLRASRSGGGACRGSKGGAERWQYLKPVLLLLRHSGS